MRASSVSAPATALRKGGKQTLRVPGKPVKENFLTPVSELLFSGISVRERLFSRIDLRERLFARINSER
jgi:hypothetical protein